MPKPTNRLLKKLGKRGWDLAGYMKSFRNVWRLKSIRMISSSTESCNNGNKQISKITK